MSAPNYSLIRATHGDGRATVVLNNPARRNAIGPVMVNELCHAFADAFADEGVRVVVLTGEGDKAFCAGGDFAQMSGESKLPHKGDYADLLLLMLRAPKPIIARVNGHAMGGGLGLVAASHFAIGVESAKLGTPEIDVGLFPMMIMAVLRLVMPRRALVKMMLLGERLTASQAAELDLLHRAVPNDQLDTAVNELADALAAKSPIALKLGLEAMAAQEELGVEEALPMLRDRLAGCLATEDAQEGLSAFLQKRAPVWKGR